MIRTPVRSACSIKSEKRHISFAGSPSAILTKLLIEIKSHGGVAGASDIAEPLGSNIESYAAFQSVIAGLNMTLTVCRAGFTASISRVSFSFFLPTSANPMIQLQAQSMSNGGFSDALRDKPLR